MPRGVARGTTTIAGIAAGQSYLTISLLVCKFYPKPIK